MLLTICAASVWAEMPRSAAQYREDVIRAQRFYLPQVRVSWLAGQIHQESRWQAGARSRVGALGLMQIMPATAKDIAHACDLPGFDPLSPRQAVRGGACYDASLWRLVRTRLSAWSSTTADQWVLTTRGYNGGAGYLLRESRRLGELGLTAGPAAWLGTVCGQFRSESNCRENLAYPIQIQRWARLYEGWE